MRVLVTVASKHGATAEIGQAIADHLTGAGHDVDLRPPEEVHDLHGVEAAVVGSAVYAGHWVKSARELIDRMGGELAGRPVWVFSSGPVGDPLQPAEEPVDGAAALAVTRAREHKIFPGRIDTHRLQFGERVIVRSLGAAIGDFRDWDAVARWAASIDAALREG